MTDSQKQFLDQASAQASAANHPFPQMAAAEAALESAFGTSELARDGNNLFGLKQGVHPRFGTLSLPTREFENGQWIATEANWVKYDDVAECFADRLATLERLAPEYPHYASALQADDAYGFVTQVSQTWSTDPNRAAKVIAIYQEYIACASSPSTT